MVVVKGSFGSKCENLALLRGRQRSRSRCFAQFATGRSANLGAHRAARHLTPACPPMLCHKPIAEPTPLQPPPVSPRGQIPIAPAAPPVHYRPRFRALALFERRPHERVEGLIIAGVRKPAQEPTSVVCSFRCCSPHSFLTWPVPDCQVYEVELTADCTS
jgi:hypothetical protein